MDLIKEIVSNFHQRATTRKTMYLMDHENNNDMDYIYILFDPMKWNSITICICIIMNFIINKNIFVYQNIFMYIVYKHVTISMIIFNIFTTIFVC